MVFQQNDRKDRLMSDFEIERYEHAGFTVVIEQEQYIEDFMNPREEDFNLGVMLCSHRDYTLGDEQIDGEDFRPMITCPQCDGSGDVAGRFELIRQSVGVVGVGTEASMDSEMETINRLEGNRRHWVEPKTCPRCEGECEIEVGILEYLKVERKATVILPLFLYDHSGISMSAGGRLDKGQDDFSRSGRYALDSAGWDVSSVGVIYATAERAAELGVTGDDEEIEKGLREEVKIYDQYLRGECFWFHVDDEDGEVLESIGGFLGDLDYVKAQANEAAECCRKAADAETAEATEMAARDIITRG